MAYVGNETLKPAVEVLSLVGWLLNHADPKLEIGVYHPRWVEEE